ncbi:MAG TPA: NAD(P)-binding domain-containing protein, partial [Euzebya sp.]|nr:NAD(P)-binding domain-containing protein [Euzebya sp.]
YAGPEPHGFMHARQVVGFFEAYAATFDPPVHTGVTVAAVRPRPAGGWYVTTDQGPYEAANVVVATGHMGMPAVPAAARRLPSGLLQLHSSGYRNPQQLPGGRVLVVGAGPSAQQIADELAVAGRDVVLAVGGHRALPRRYRGHDVYWWMERLGLLRRTIDTLPDPAAAARTTRSSVLMGGEEDLDLRRLHRNGVRMTGRILDASGTRLRLGRRLARDLADADANATRLRAMVDDHVRRTGLSVPDEPWSPPDVPAWAADAPGEMDLASEGVSAVVWGTGYRRDWSWIHAPVFDAHGEVVHRRGITAAPGLSFLGLRWLHRRNSGFIDGVGADAVHLAAHLTRTRSPQLVPASA